jgi:hypothetical protein
MMVHEWPSLLGLTGWIGLANRVDGVRVRLDTPSGLDIQLFAKEAVPVDRASLAEVGTLSEIADTIAALNHVRYFGDVEA